MINDTERIVYPVECYERATAPLTQPRTTINPYALDLLAVAARFIVCLIAIALGLWIAVHGSNDGIAILAALGCAGVIGALLGPKGE